MGLREGEHGYEKTVEANRAQVDEVLSRYLPVHTLDMTPEELRKARLSPYGRDNINEIGNVLFAMPTLLRSRKEREAGQPETSFERLLARIGYARQVEGTFLPLSDNGRFVLGGSFGLVSTKAGFDDQTEQKVGLKIPTYEVHQVSAVSGPGIYTDYGNCLVIDENVSGHIDCRFNIVDQAKVIYVAMGARPGTMKERPNPHKERTFAMLRRAAQRHGYELRDYIVEDERIAEEVRDPKVQAVFDRFGTKLTIGYVHNGINFVTYRDHLFTSIIGHGERTYLESRGVKVVEVPLKFTYAGAGLRCTYGELTTQVEGQAT